MLTTYWGLKYLEYRDYYYDHKIMRYVCDDDWYVRKLFESLHKVVNYVLPI